MATQKRRLPGDVVTALSEIFEGGHFDRIIQKELEVYLISLRTMIREELEADEKEQLEMRAEESQSGGPAYVNAIPKNDYRRHQNGTERARGAIGTQTGAR